MKSTLHSTLVTEVLFTERIYSFLHNPTNGLLLLCATFLPDLTLKNHLGGMPVPKVAS